MKQQKQEDQKPTSQMNLLIRVLIGGYLIYLAWSLRGSFPQPLYVIAAAAFALIGIVLVINSLSRIFKGDYDFVDSDGNVIIPDDLPEDEDP
jgi:hypothetical protein